MPRRKVGFLGLEVWEGEFWEEGVEGERMKTPTPTRTWGGIFWRVFSCFFYCCAGGLVGCLFWEMVVVVVIFSCVWE